MKREQTLMKKTWKISIASVIVLGAVVAGVFFFPNLTTSTASHAASVTNPYCVNFTQAVPSTTRPHTFDLQTTKQTCYATNSQALQAANSGTVNPSATSPATIPTNAMIEVFQNGNFGGVGVIYTSPNTGGCLSGYAYKIPSIGTFGGVNMNDQISSFKLLNSCKSTELFADGNFNNNTFMGAEYSYTIDHGATPNVAYLGNVMNDQTSSIMVYGF